MFQTRFVVKYRNCDGNLVLKVTDDKVVSIIYFRCSFDGESLVQKNKVNKNP